MACKKQDCCPPSIFPGTISGFIFCNEEQTATASCPEGFHNSIGPDEVSVTVEANTVGGVTQEIANAEAYAQALAQAQLLLDCVPDVPEIQQDMPLDQAIYVPAAGSRDAYIAGVRGGYVHKFSPTTGALVSSARFSAPNFGQSSICFVPGTDDRDEYLLCSFWNEMRCDDYLQYESTNRKGFYKINPTDLTVISFIPDPSSFSTDFSILGDTAQGSGPFDLIFFNDFIYCLRANIMKINPDDMTLITEDYRFPTTGNDSQGYLKLLGDGLVDRIWITNGSQELVTIPATPENPPDQFGLSTSSHASCGSSFVVTYDPLDLGTITIGNIGDPVPTGPLDFGVTLDANSWYTMTYEGGAVNRAETGKFFIYEGEAISGFRSGFYTIPGLIFYPILPGLFISHYLPFSNLGVGFTGMYDSLAECEAGQAGAVYGIGPGLTGSLNFLSEGFGLDIPGNVVTDTIASPLVFRLRRTYVRTPSSTTGFNPYGIAHDPVNNRIFAIRNRTDVGVFTVPEITPNVGFDPDWLFIPLGDSDAIPYRIRYNSADGLMYIATLKSDKIIRIDSNTLTVRDTITGFDSPYDVVFTPTKAFAVQHGLVGLKEIVPP